MKIKFSGKAAITLVGVLIFASSVSAQSFDFDINEAVINPQVEVQKKASLECALSGSVYLIPDTVQNRITFQVMYQSDNYKNRNAPFSIKATGNAGAVLYQKSGTFNLDIAGLVPMLGRNEDPEDKFTFSAKEHSIVTLTAKVDGKTCVMLKLNANKNFSAKALLIDSGQDLDINLNGGVRLPSPSISAATNTPPAVVIVEGGNQPAPQVNAQPVRDEGQNVPEIEAAPVVGGGVVDSGNQKESDGKREILSRGEERERDTLNSDVPKEKDYILYGLLSGILVAMITYMVLKTKGKV